MRTAEAELLHITKNEQSSLLAITLLQEKEEMKIPREVVKHIIGDAIKDVVFGHLFPNPFIASAERTGTAIFRKELNFPRNRIFEELSHTDNKINPIELLFKIYKDYALPVTTNVEFSRQLESISKQKSIIAERYPDILSDFADIIGGEYIIKNDKLSFIPRGKRIHLSMGESSSSVRSLLDIGYYLRHIAQIGDLLMIDEPELNLHPENQRRVARLFTRLVNIGLKVFVTTHSDYIIKELNTLIMLNNKNNQRLVSIMNREGYKQEETISCDNIKVYIAEEANIKQEGRQRSSRCLTLTSAKISTDTGIEVGSFDKTIDAMNRIQDEIVWGE